MQINNKIWKAKRKASQSVNVYKTHFCALAQ